MKLKYHLLALAALTAVSFITYGQTLAFGFIWDDYPLIKYNVWANNLGLWPEYFTSSIGAGYYRPILTLAYAVQRYFFGDNSSLYHLVNIILHTVNGMLVYILIGRLIPSADQPLFRFFAGLVFIVHPIQTMILANIAAGSNYLLYTLFSLLSLIFLFVTKDRAGFFRLGAVVTSVLALLTNESAIMLPILIVFISFLPGREKRSWSLLRWLVIFLAILMAYGLIRYRLSPDLTQLVNDTGSGETITTVTRFYSALAVAGFYARYTLLPTSLASVHVVDPVHEPSLAFIGTFLVVAVVLWISWIKRQRYPILLFSCGWFLITLSPATILGRTGRSVFDARAYLPMVGVATLLAAPLAKLFQMVSTSILKRILLAILVMATVVLTMVWTAKRSSVWSDEITFYQSLLPTMTDYLWIHTSLGNAYSRQGDFHRALIYYQKALAVDPASPLAHHNVGVALYNLDKVIEAELEWKKAIVLDSSHQPSYDALIRMYLDRKELEKAKKILTRASLIFPQETKYRRGGEK